MTGIWPFVPSNAPTSLAHAKGSYLYLQNGKKILDAAGGAVVANVGHGRREVADAIHAATLNATYVVPPWLTPEREALVHELREHWLPEHLPCVHLCSGGSEGNDGGGAARVDHRARELEKLEALGADELPNKGSAGGVKEVRRG